MLKKLLLVVIEFVSSKMVNPATDLTQILANVSLEGIRKTMALVACVLVGVLLAWTGVITVIADLIVSSHSQQQLHLSSVSWIGFALFMISLGLVILAIKKDMRVQTPQHAGKGSSALSDALADLIHDFIEERKLNRAAAGLDPSSVAPQSSVHTDPVPPPPRTTFEPSEWSPQSAPEFYTQRA